MCPPAPIRTDYQFKDIEEAITLTRFFFGEAMADKVKTNRSTVLPECTGVWYGSLGRSQSLDKQVQSS
ncbi:MAG: hypothetical protein A2603_13150 [Bdellovibrionales bacterium RIFOXYD1_FULL_55_31]|nr:MAG: hypothetical protein A2603_13150 [Bdellovibrionales bacterium RIFOXYD1_FULL_55_31]